MEYDSAPGQGTRLYHTYARYYHPRLQRFLSEDPLGFGAGNVDLYGYVGNSPINMIDPNGELAAAGAAGGVVGFLVAALQTHGNMSGGQAALAIVIGIGATVAVVGVTAFGVEFAAGLAGVEAAGLAPGVVLAIRAAAAGLVNIGAAKMTGGNLAFTSVALSVTASTLRMGMGMQFSQLGIPSVASEVTSSIVSGEAKVLSTFVGLVLSQSPSGGSPAPAFGQAALSPSKIPSSGVPAAGAGMDLPMGNFTPLDGIGGVDVPVGGGVCSAPSFM